MKNIQINLSAIASVNYTEILEVPDHFSEQDLAQLIALRRETVSARLYEIQTDDWTVGHCDHEPAPADSVPTGTVIVDAGSVMVRAYAEDEDRISDAPRG